MLGHEVPAMYSPIALPLPIRGRRQTIDSCIEMLIDTGMAGGTNIVM
jgi:hypothetical protein